MDALIGEPRQPMRWHQIPHHANMGPVSGEEEQVAAVKARLQKAARADKRATEAKERTRTELRQAIIEASRLGLGPAEVTKDIEHHLSEGHVSRVILGKA